MSKEKNISNREMEQARRKTVLGVYNSISETQKTDSFKSKMSRVCICFATIAFVITILIFIVRVLFVSNEQDIDFEKTVGILKPIIKLLLLFIR